MKDLSLQLQSYEVWAGKLKNETAVSYWYTGFHTNLALVHEGVTVSLYCKGIEQGIT